MSAWLEIQSPRESLKDVYRVADKCRATSVHHFYEPWFEGGAVVRVRLRSEANAEKALEAFAEIGCVGGPWDASHDEQLFAPNWDAVADFFAAGSRIALEGPTDWHRGKLIHCAMNSWGVSREDELRFHAERAYGHLRILLHWYFRKLVPLRRSCKYGCHQAAWRTRSIWSFWRAAA